MNKSEMLEKYSKPEDKLLVSKILDKIEACTRKNIVTCTDFLDMSQFKIVQSVLNAAKCNYIFNGGYNEASRNIAIIYPEKLTEDMILKSLNNYMKIIRVELPKNLYGEYKHKDYLSGIMKLGIKREKFGDILVEETGADIIASKEISEYIEQNIKQLIRFSKSIVSLQNIENIRKIELKKEDIKIVIQSLRLDNIVAGLANTSRTKASEIIESARVSINYEEQFKVDKQVREKDIIVIRGKGKFEIDKIEGNTRKNKQILNVKKYV